jgi:Flp pilus assembly protein TadG
MAGHDTSPRGLIAGLTGLVRASARRRGRALACRRGAAAVEFAIIAPVFLVLVLGTVELGRAMWIKGSIQFAVEETSRYALVNTSASMSDLQTYAENALVGVDSSDVTFQAQTESADGYSFVSITGTHSFSVLVPIVPLPDVTLSAKSRVPLNP